VNTCYKLITAISTFALATPLMASFAIAQTYTTRPVRLVVPYPPGGATDFTAREIAQALSESMGQQFVVDNRSGAAGTMGHHIVAKAAPDGYTLVVGTFGGLVTGPALMGAQLPYDPEKDFVPIGLAVHTPWALVLNPAVPAKSVKEIIDLAKASPGKLNYASTGTGTPNHLGMVLLLMHANINMIHVPYRSAGQITVDLISGQVQSVFSGVPQILPHHRAGRLRIIGVGHPVRLSALPDVPAIAETVPGFNNSGFYGLLAPPNTPRVLVDRLNGELKKAFSAPERVARLEGQGVVAATSTPQEFAALIRKDLVLWRKVVKDANIKPD
jgi:tripartite-type tricarboxylate transporter receptor subunit TctC